MTSSFSLRRTGLTVFFARIFSALTGITFLIILTHSISVADFGLWEFIVDIVAFASYPAGIIGFWTSRAVARGLPLARTSIVLAMSLSVLGAGGALVASVALHANVGSPLSHFLLAAPLVPLTYWTVSSVSIAVGYRPSITASAVVLSEVSKLAAAYASLFVLKLGIDGVIVSVEIAYFVQAGVATFLAKDILVGPIDWSRGKRWFLDSWIPLINTLSGTLLQADTFIAPLILASTVTNGYYQATFALASVVTYSAYLSVGLYPLLLRGESGKLSSLALEFSLMFGLPMVVGEIVLARPILSLLKQAYVEGQVALAILAVSAFGLALSSILDSTLLGNETVDIQSKVGFLEYRKSDLVFVPVVNLSYSVGYIVVLSAFLAVGASLPSPEILDGWAVVQLGAVGSMVAIKAVRVRRKNALSIPRSVYRHALAAAVMGVVAVGLSGLVIDYTSGSLVLGAGLVIVIAVSSAVYFGILYFADPEFKALATAFVGRRARGSAKTDERSSAGHPQAEE